MPVIRIFEPALCCNTGVCGPDVDESLVRFTADLGHLTRAGADIARHNLANDPTAFAEAPAVRAFLHVAGSEGLPLTLVDGVTVQTGSYPTRARLLRYAGLPLTAPADATPAAAGAADVVPAGATVLGLAPQASSCSPESGCC